MKQALKYSAATILALLPTYYIRFSVLGLPTNIIEVLIVLLFVVAAVADYAAIAKSPLLRAYGKQIGVLLLGIIIGVAISPDKKMALGILKGWFVIPLLYATVVSALFENEDYPLIIYALFLSIISVSLYGLLQYKGLIGLLPYQSASADISAYVNQGRALAFFESPNYLAMFLVPPTLLCFAYFQTLKKYWLSLALVIPALAVFLTDSRAGLLALLGGAIFITLSRYNRKVAVWVSIVLSAVALLVLLELPHVGGSGGDQARSFIWQQAYQLIVSHPVFGIGPGQFAQALNQKLSADVYYQTTVRAYALHPHNIFLSFYLSGGLLSLGAFLLILKNVFYRLWQKTRDNATAIGLIAAIGAILVHGLFDTTYFKNDLSLHFWLLIGLSAMITVPPAIKYEKNRD